jgi:subtilisin family serine protease
MDETHSADESYVPYPGVSLDPETATVAEILSVIATRSEANSREGSAIPTTPSASARVVPVASTLPARLVVRRASAGRMRDGEPPEIVAAMRLASSPLFPGAADSEDPFGLADYFLVELPGSRADVGSLGHELAYRLGGHDDVVAAYYEGAAGYYVGLGSILGGGTPPADRNWARSAVGVPSGPAGGANVTIGHPDTGWTPHPELDTSALDLARQWNTLDENANAVDPLDFLLFNGHGTGTASLMVSGPAGQINGVAPAARVLPIRCARSVVLILDTELAQAVWYAVGQQADVLSISLGGFPVPYLESVVAHAARVANMIVCASAGNVSPFVVYPAAYPDCIAVAGTTPTDRPWRLSSFGPQVAVSAPAHLVWVADFDGQRNPVAAAPGSGTSFATPHVAAAAALWLAQNGRAQLLQRYAGVASLAAVFRRLLSATARLPGPFPAPGGTGDVAEGAAYTWEAQRYGPGILDIASLLAVPLPAASDFPVPTPQPLTWLDVLDNLFTDLTRDDITGRLSTVIGAPGGDVPRFVHRFGAELVQILMDDPAAREGFLSLPPMADTPPKAAAAETAARGHPGTTGRDRVLRNASATLRAAARPTAPER